MRTHFLHFTCLTKDGVFDDLFSKEPDVLSNSSSSFLLLSFLLTLLEFVLALIMSSKIDLTKSSEDSAHCASELAVAHSWIGDPDAASDSREESKMSAWEGWVVEGSQLTEVLVSQIQGILDTEHSLASNRAAWLSWKMKI